MCLAPPTKQVNTGGLGLDLHLFSYTHFLSSFSSNCSFSRNPEKPLLAGNISIILRRRLIVHLIRQGG